MNGSIKDVILRHSISNNYSDVNILSSTGMSAIELKDSARELAEEGLITEWKKDGFRYYKAMNEKRDYIKSFLKEGGYSAMDLKIGIEPIERHEILKAAYNNSLRHVELPNFEWDNPFSRRRQIFEDLEHDGLLDQEKGNFNSKRFKLTKKGMEEYKSWGNKEEAPTVKAKGIFIGHGRTQDWKDIYSELSGSYKINCFSFEHMDTTSKHIIDILKEAKGSASTAIIVMTGDDLTADGQRQARQNVIHEIGFFQGALSFGNTIIMAEEGINHFSNMDGYQRIDYPKGNIQAGFNSLVKKLRQLGELK